jgi:hypothetical protein
MHIEWPSLQCHTAQTFSLLSHLVAILIILGSRWNWGVSIVGGLRCTLLDPVLTLAMTPAYGDLSSTTEFPSCDCLTCFSSLMKSKTVSL